VLLIDDDKTLGLLLKPLLEKEGFEVSIYNDSIAGTSHFLNTSNLDILLLDVMMPGLDGFEVLSKVRSMGDDRPIIMLTARGEASDKITGLRAGADDYLAKPFDHLELAARIEAVVRRQIKTTATTNSEPVVETLPPLNNYLDQDTRQLLLHNKNFSLTPLEFKILDILTTTPGKVYTRSDLMLKIDPLGDSDAFDRSICMFLVCATKLN
jgi:two-component system, OmpR family, response regulator CpxR